MCVIQLFTTILINLLIDYNIDSNFMFILNET